MKMFKILEKIELFFLKPASARPLGALRIGLALVLLLQVYLLRSSVVDFFAGYGIVQGELANYFIAPYSPRLSWIVNSLSYLGIGESISCYSCCGIYILSLVFLLLGLFTRTASFLVWALHWILMNTSETTSYGVDLYAHVFLFYLMWSPAGSAFSLDVFLHRCSSKSSSEARLGIRVMQLHLCLTYFFSAWEKAKGVQWWNGEILWRALTLPEYRQFDLEWLVDWPKLLRFGGWAGLALELGYCVFIWPKLSRKIWLAGIVGLHLGIVIFLGLTLFGIEMCVFSLTLFGISAEQKMKKIFIWAKK